MSTLYLIIGLVLVAALVVVIIHYFSPGRKEDVEAAKYEMLRDEPLGNHLEDDPPHPKTK